MSMGTELYTQLMPPFGLDEMSSIKLPSLCILKDSLCFSHDYKRTEFIIWKMKTFGVKEYHDFADLEKCQLLPLHLSDHNDTLILANNQEQRAILYNLRNNTANTSRHLWISKRSRHSIYQNGLDGSYLDCYMNEHQDSTTEEAQRHVANKISIEWKHHNQ
ncbi:hypothetical protein MTR_3g055070 [Medicago truncatula]|uniref:Uncharacterized protein n=1 Tax=Medicago truncatula TaxID=3880 RepID=G7J027_MEDTR|nr:hypothetical protein MTR_3g055070 [Medicago truncatula]